ncbi:MAG: HAD-IIIC family phosphatase [Elusimicrobia bacterium]|nr:HAD-IIIC family phosphatase [Elusimicrobiota bacterium]
MPPLKITLLSSFNADSVAKALPAAAQAAGVPAEITQLRYSQGVQAPRGTDLLIIALDLRDLFPEFYHALLPMHCSEIEARCNSVIDAVSGLAKDAGRVLVNNFTYPQHLGTGIFDSQNSEGQMAWIDRLNSKLATLAETRPGTYIFGLQHCMFRYGADRALSLSGPFRGVYYTPGFSACLAAGYARFLSTLFLPRKKCLVLDLDNTLWGGVLGEDGPDGIQLAASGPGAAYAAIQREALQYADQGILLAINSRNDEKAVREVFDSHPSMVLKWEDFSARMVNWEDKASNLRAIAARLNIGLDSLVFADDSPYEIALVRRALPQVATVLLSGAPANRLRLIREMPFFSFLEYTQEDISRRKFYRAEEARGAARTKFATLQEYYRDLAMSAEILVSDRKAATRVAQLSQKTNQFNLTGRRYTQDEMVQAMSAGDSAVYSLRLTDRFGDSGIVGAAVIRKRKECWEIEAFLLSCRAIGRTAETALLAAIQEDSARSGAGKLLGRYLPTGRNGMCADFYARSGFSRKAGDAWEFDNSSGNIPFPQWIGRLSKTGGSRAPARPPAPRGPETPK